MAADARDLAEPLRAVVLQLLELDGRITVTSALRSRAEQARLRITNGCPDVDRSPASACRVPTAIPGTSRHETGQAVDLADGTPDRRIIAGLIAQHGLPLQRTVPGEPWHYEHSGGGAGVPVSSGGSGGGGGGWSILDPATWLRVTWVVVGLGLAALGLVLVGTDLGRV